MACIGALWLVAGKSQRRERGDNDVDLSTTSSYAPCGLLGCGGVNTASLKGKFTHHNLDNSLNHYIIQLCEQLQVSIAFTCDTFQVVI